MTKGNGRKKKRVGAPRKRSAKPETTDAALKQAAHGLVLELCREGLLNQDHPAVIALGKVGNRDANPAPPDRAGTIMEEFGSDLDLVISQIELSIGDICQALNRIGLDHMEPAGESRPISGDQGRPTEAASSALNRVRNQMNSLFRVAHHAKECAVRISKFV